MRRVAQIERLRPQLNFHALGDPEIAGDIQIEIGGARPAKLVKSRGSEGHVSDRRVRQGIEIWLVIETVANDRYVGEDLVRGLRTPRAVTRGGGGRHGKRNSRVVREDAVQAP